uniref:MIP33041p1 n=1 Tax=Drosophila melanogaster TaxID=7227 RepID=G4LU09_DROME|nr:MIP33041p1 [Drosophila melanogaster]
MQRHKMQITRRNNQIENESEQNAIKVDDKPNGNCSTKEHNSTQLHGPKGTGRTRFRCSAGQDFPTTPASSPNFPVSQPIRSRQHRPPPPTCQPIEINNQQIFA